MVMILWVVTIRNLATELKNLTSRVQGVEGNKGIEGLNFEDLCIQPDIELPEGYKPPKFEQFSNVLSLYLFGYISREEVRKLADKVAAAGYYVVVPDFLYGDPYNPENTEKPLSIWIQSHGTDKGFEDAKKVVAALKDKGISAIGAAGFCWGAKVVTDLAKSDYIQAAVQLHPSLVKVDDIKEVKAPIAILAAEVDRISPPELIKQFEEILSSKPEVDSFVKIFPSVKHGWTVRYNVEDKEAVQSAEEAHRHMLDWFSKYVK